jgi:hypothetical protein
VAVLLEGMESNSEPTPTPKRVSARDIEQIRAFARVFGSWGGLYGGEAVRDAVMSQLWWSADLLKATYTDEQSPKLHSALGDLAAVAGFIAEGAGAREQADWVYRFALACAEKAGDWPLRGEILSSMAKKAIRAGQPDEGLTLAEQGLVRADRLTVAGRSMLHADRGRALAKMRRVQETLTAIGAADDHFAHFTSGNEPPWMANYNPARHAQLTGGSLFYLAILGHDPGEAADRLAAAAAGQPDQALSQTICQAKLASLTMATGDPLHAATIGHAAVDAAGTIRSQLAAEELRELSRHAALHQNLDEVAHLRYRIATLLVGADSP